MCSNSLRESSKTHFDSIIINNALLDFILAKCMLNVLLNVSFTIFL